MRWLKQLLNKNSNDQKNLRWELWQEKWDNKKVDGIWGKKLRNKDWQRDPAYKLVAEQCKKYGKTVLDIGSGGGVQYAALSKYTPDIVYAGVDITQRHIDFARKMFPNVRFQLADAENLPFKDKEFDVSMIRHIIEHQPKEKAENIISQAIRVSKNALLILFFIPPVKMEQDVLIKRKKSGFFLNTYSKDWVAKQIEKAGFRFETIFIEKADDSTALYDQELYICSNEK